MHANISITDGIYGMHSNVEKKKLLSNFNPEKTDLANGLNQKLDEILTFLKKNTPINSEQICHIDMTSHSKYGRGLA